MAGIQFGSSKPQIVTQVEMAEAWVPLAYHDQCVHLRVLPPLEVRARAPRLQEVPKIREAQEAKVKGDALIGLIPATAKLA
uniref:Uncharacterized protein n=1 Tax=Setaria viridis TaxID=4556 RepID=A0A4U6UC07_SETVI|nr:hypothetical protein SEVIR_5G102600v2 [Setaria viridis]